MEAKAPAVIEMLPASVHTSCHCVGVVLLGTPLQDLGAPLFLVDKEPFNWGGAWMIPFTLKSQSFGGSQLSSAVAQKVIQMCSQVKRSVALGPWRGSHCERKYKGRARHARQRHTSLWSPRAQVWQESALVHGLLQCHLQIRKSQGPGFQFVLLYQVGAVNPVTSWW